MGRSEAVQVVKRSILAAELGEASWKLKRATQKILQKSIDEEKKMLHNLVSLLLTNKTI